MDVAGWCVTWTGVGVLRVGLAVVEEGVVTDEPLHCGLSVGLGTELKGGSAGVNVERLHVVVHMPEVHTARLFPRLLHQGDLLGEGMGTLGSEKSTGVLTLRGLSS